MQETLSLVTTVAKQKMPVLLLGETGTGKELLAQAIHGLSDRFNAAFIAQDCGALTETLLESELFGHVRGAFTGAVTDHAGLLQVADGGTVFLDEVENTTAALQVKLLRAIETGEIRPVGSPRSKRVDIRIVAASNRDLRAEAEAGRFRADLYYRLSPFPIDVPPLRERGRDILLLAHEFLTRAKAAMGKQVDDFSAEAEAALLAHNWPGNVRELKNAVDRAVLLTPDGHAIGLAHLPAVVRSRQGAGNSSGAGEDLSLDDQLANFERDLIVRALERNNGVIRRAAADLKVNQVTLARRARQLRILQPERRSRTRSES